MGVKVKSREFDVVAIDEGQFFTDIVEFCEELPWLVELLGSVLSSSEQANKQVDSIKRDRIFIILINLLLGEILFF